MGPLRFDPLSRAVDQRRSFVDRVDSGTGGVSRYTMFATIDDPGELVIPVNFPLVFSEKPVFYWGAEMDPGSTVADGGYPMVCPVVRNWVFQVNEQGARFYTGATILVIATGVDSQTMIIGCHFEGRAVRGNI